MSGDNAPYIEVTSKISTVQKKNTYEIILEQLEKLILTGTLKDGQKLPGERLLSEKFGTSRNSVRVALKLLEFMNLIEVRPGSGVYVSSNHHVKQAAFNSDWTALLKQHPLMDLIEARRCFEPFIAGLAAQHATEEEIQEMDADLRQMEAEITKRGQAVKHASHFHELLFKSSHNIILAQIGLMLNSLMDESKKISLNSRENTTQSLNKHREILTAIKNHDPISAAQIMQEHLQGVKEHLVKAGLDHK